ncbi:hypothetical protein [Streptomyces atratus]|uniref:hypothetical protein n=1 Tax=Streptomyces atratus TaxID=1893 RepID=UPI00386B10DC
MHLDRDGDGIRCEWGVTRTGLEGEAPMRRLEGLRRRRHVELAPLFERRRQQGADQVSDPEPLFVCHPLQVFAIRLGQRHVRKD